MKYEPAYLLALATWPVTVCATNAQADSLRIARPAAFPAVSRHQTLDSLKAEVKLQLEQRYGQHYGCSALSLSLVVSGISLVKVLVVHLLVPSRPWGFMPAVIRRSICVWQLKYMMSLKSNREPSRVVISTPVIILITATDVICVRYRK